MSTYPTDGGSVNRNYTSDQQARPNGMSREEFIWRVLHSGEVTKIAQHLAVVIFLLAEGSNQAKASVRDLERITGWSRTAIADHLAELDVFMRITFGSGRAKAIFELQGVIEDAIATAVVSGSRAATVATTVVAAEADAIVASGADTKPVVASQVAAVVASEADTSLPDKKKVSPHTPLQRKTSPTNTLSCSDSEHARESELIQVSSDKIEGPGFVLDLRAIDMAAALMPGMSKERARAIAEICALDWAANKTKPPAPMAVVKAAIRSDFNQGQVHEVRLGKAKADPQKPASGQIWDAKTQSDMDWGTFRRTVLAGESS